MYDGTMGCRLPLFLLANHSLKESSKSSIVLHVPRNQGGKLAEMPATNQAAPEKGNLERSEKTGHVLMEAGWLAWIAPSCLAWKTMSCANLQTSVEVCDPAFQNQGYNG